MTRARGFAHSERLTRKAEFDRVQKEGRTHRLKDMLVQVLPNGSPCSRLGMVVGRRVGGAVVRNRLKRLIREAFRLNKHLLVVGHDIVVIPHRGLTDWGLSAVEAQLRRLFEKLS